MSTGTARPLPGHDLIGLEHGFEEPLVRPLVGDAVHGDAGGQRRGGRAGQERDGDGVTGGEVALDGGPRERGVAALEDVERARHQNAMKRRAARTRSAICSRVTRTTSWPSAFHSGSAGTAEASTWNGMLSRLRLARNFATSSPSTRSSVSPSSRWTAGPASTNVTSFSPATMPMPIRMASKARPVACGSWVMRTRTGSSATTTRSVESDEALGRVDQIGEHHEAAVGHTVGVVERDTALLAAVRAHEELGAAIGQRAHARIVERAHAVVDQVEVEIGAAREGGLRQTEGGREIRRVLGTRGQQHPELFLRQIHRGRSVASRMGESKE